MHRGNCGCTNEEDHGFCRQRHYEIAVEAAGALSAGALSGGRRVPAACFPPRIHAFILQCCRTWWVNGGCRSRRLRLRRGLGHSRHWCWWHWLDSKWSGRRLSRQRGRHHQKGGRWHQSPKPHVFPHFLFLLVTVGRPNHAVLAVDNEASALRFLNRNKILWGDQGHGGRMLFRGCALS